MTDTSAPVLADNYATRPPVELPLAPATLQHLEEMERFYEGAPIEPNFFGRFYRKLLANYYRHFIPADASILEVGCGNGELLSFLPNADVTGVDVSPRQVAAARQRVPRGTFHVQSGELLDLNTTFDAIILSDTLNFAADVELMLRRLHRVAGPDTRVICNFYSSLWRPILSTGTLLGLKAPMPQSNWLSTADVHNLFQLADWEVIKFSPRLLWPIPSLGLDRLVNRFVAPLLPWFCLTVFGIARPRRIVPASPCDTTIVIPARNEAGNIENAIKRIPEFGRRTEIVFIEGHSKDETWEEIKRVAEEYPDRHIVAMRQTGKGKGNAVREAFAVASGDILMILDADLTMPPEELPKFYDAISSGRADFANGVRLVYPMQKRAMQFLNLCANKIFGILFSWLLGQSVKDTLCGTKVLSRVHYEKLAANREYFGEFDPFGDFDLLFGADKLNLKIVDIPIRYQERIYGSTNIQRWRHGWLLLRMVVFAARKLKFV